MDPTTNGNNPVADIEIDAPPDDSVGYVEEHPTIRVEDVWDLLCRVEDTVNGIQFVVMGLAAKLEQLDALLEHYRPLLERADARMRRASMFSRQQ